MAREKGTGSLQREKSGRYTLRVGINGKRYSRSTGARDRDAAERFAARFLAPFGRGPKHLPLADVWFEYECSPNRRDLASATLASKRQVWMHFARWMEKGHLEVSELGQLTSDMVGEYLRCLRIGHCGTTYNNHVCVLREICRTLYDKAGIYDDPWSGVRLLCDDSHTRREFTLDELQRILEAAKKRDEEDGRARHSVTAEIDNTTKAPLNNDCGRQGTADPTTSAAPSTRHTAPGTTEWHTLFLIGIYTGLRLGDCCTLEWANVNLERKVIQVIPQKTRKHAHGHPVTIPIHPMLEAALRSAFSGNQGSGIRDEKMGCGREGTRDPTTPSTIPHHPFLILHPSQCVLPTLSEWYKKTKWRVSEGLKRIFAAANITTSVRIEGRRYKAPEATFHSLRHTFVSLAANAGVPLTIIQSIVGHESTAMTRHYYHESEAALQTAIAALPDLERKSLRDIQDFGFQNGRAMSMTSPRLSASHGDTLERLKQLDELLANKVITRREYKATRARILGEL